MRFSKLAVLMVFAVSVAMSPVFSAGSAEGSAASDEPIELVYWSHYSQSPAFVEAFADSVELAAKNLGYDNVTCRAEIIEYSGYEAKYITGFTSGTGPDFFLGYPSDWALNGGKNPVALPFDEKASAAWNEALANVYYDHGIFNGERYGFPSEGGSLQIIYINTDAMIEAGLDPETDIPTTMDEFLEVAKALTKRDEAGNIIRSGFQPRYLGGGDGVAGKYIAWFHNFGARILSEDLSTSQGYVNSAEAKEAFKWFQNLVKETSNLELGAPESAFQSGQAAMINREAWFADDTVQKAPNINFVCASFPAGTYDYAPGSGSSVWCNMISARTKYPELCQEIMAELAKPEYDITLHESAAYPPVCKATMTLDNEYFGKQLYAEAVMNMADKPSCPVYDLIPEWSQIASMFGDTVASIVGGADVDTELDALAVRIDQVLNQ